jgi:undecaprenyl-diphosphatase
MSILEGFLQGVVQGLTEFLPVSSSGHLSLFQHFFGISGESSLFFTVMLHLGTLLAVFIAYFNTIIKMIVEFFKMIGDLLGRRFDYKKSNEERMMVLMLLVSLLPLLVLFFAKGFFSRLSGDNDIIVEGVCFLFTGSILFLADKSVKGYKTAVDMKPRDALRIGLFQGFAMFPGVSRSGSTISAGLMSGFSREFMVKFSFIMGIPTILGAAVTEFYDAYKIGIVFEPVPMLIGVVTAAVVGLLAIKLIRFLVKTDRFGVFAYYTLALGIVVIVIGMIELFGGFSIANLFAAG